VISMTKQKKEQQPKDRDIVVCYYRIWWDSRRKKGTIRIYDANDTFIGEGNQVFTSLAEMQAFANLFLGRGATTVFRPGTLELESGRFPTG